jgi:hypothetical protein
MGLCCLCYNSVDDIVPIPMYCVKDTVILIPDNKNAYYTIDAVHPATLTESTTYDIHDNGRSGTQFYNVPERKLRLISRPIRVLRFN